MILETERLSIRHLQPNDREWFLDLFTNPDLMTHIRDPLSREATGESFDERLTPWSRDALFWNTFVILDKDKGSRIGIISAKVDDAEADRAEVGYLLHGDHHGRGYATEALRSFVGYVFRELAFHKQIGICTSDNIASHRVLEKAGFVEEGNPRHHQRIGGTWIDGVLFGLIREDWRE